MITLQWRGTDKLNANLVRLENKIDKASSSFLDEAAEWLVNDVRSNWSASRQTIGSGNPPAIKTGNLDSSLFIEDNGRDVLGRFADRKNTKVKFVRIDTARGDNPEGRGGYSPALEDTNYYNLPFLQPAIDRLNSIYIEMAKRHMRL